MNECLQEDMTRR